MQAVFGGNQAAFFLHIFLLFLLLAFCVLLSHEKDERNNNQPN
ncbi:hypothetical protein BBR47_09380 [Brevibacillus brevis NBRC 100599]|uniref:Uncharacterized protein n=1 Tax=Brevibacillus brevis (strain 47 / JCM 6285 / NBRC 100599) TaxID=358681 RepID=C0Z5V8_BREBN|nr:hypothetical protein BBR47_09380 [Brevibacillus brevis NBRC 100599]